MPSRSATARPDTLEPRLDIFAQPAPPPLLSGISFQYNKSRVLGSQQGFRIPVAVDVRCMYPAGAALHVDGSRPGRLAGSPRPATRRLPPLRQKQICRPLRRRYPGCRRGIPGAIVASGRLKPRGRSDGGLTAGASHVRTGFAAASSGRSTTCSIQSTSCPASRSMPCTTTRLSLAKTGEHAPRKFEVIHFQRSRTQQRDFVCVRHFHRIGTDPLHMNVCVRGEQIHKGKRRTGHRARTPYSLMQHGYRTVRMGIASPAALDVRIRNDLLCGTVRVANMKPFSFLPDVDPVRFEVPDPLPSARDTACDSRRLHDSTAGP